MQGGLRVHDSVGLRSGRDGPHSTAEAGETLHVSSTEVRKAQSIAATVDQRGVVDEVDGRSIVARRPPAQLQRLQRVIKFSGTCKYQETGSL